MKRKRRASLPLTMPFGLLEIDEHGFIRGYNPTESEYKPAEIVGKNFFDAIVTRERLHEFDYEEFLDGVYLSRVFELGETKITFLQLPHGAFVLCVPMSPPDFAAEVAEQVLKRMEEVNPKFSISESGTLRVTM
jgi:hypothetical protein